eukprot:gene9541-19835_t
MEQLAQATLRDAIKEKECSKVHLLPCTIKHSGPAPVTTYFKIESCKGDNMNSSFRGRELKGKVFALPENVKGIYMTADEKSQGNVEIHGHFDEFHVWEHDLPPETTNFEEYFEWFDISDAVTVKVRETFLVLDDDKRLKYTVWFLDKAHYVLHVFHGIAVNFRNMHICMLPVAASMSRKSLKIMCCWYLKTNSGISAGSASRKL